MKRVLFSALLLSMLAACGSNPTPSANKTETVTTNSAVNTDTSAKASTNTDANASALNKQEGLKDNKLDASANAKPNPLSNNSVYFELDSNDVSPDYQGMLANHAEYINSVQAHVRVEGNTDERGSPEYNLALGQRRANAVAKVLTTLGVDKALIEAVSFGEEKPRAEGHDESAWAVNRRADITYPAADAAK